MSKHWNSQLTNVILFVHAIIILYIAYTNDLTPQIISQIKHNLLHSTPLCPSITLCI